MYTFKITEVVPASSIWPNVKSFEDKGAIDGYLRGYNIEVTTSKGITDWMSAHFFEGEPEEHFNGEFEVWHRKEWGFVPTGRITFRGYYTEHYDYEEREEYVKEAPELNEEV